MRVVNYSLKASLIQRIRIALITDLHGNSGCETLDSLKQGQPDIITIVGDFCDGSIIQYPEKLELLKEYVKLARTYFSLGNHDYLITKEDLAEIRTQGVHVLNDEWERLNDFNIVIGGLTSSFYHKCEHHDPLEKMALVPELAWLDEFEMQEGYKILLDHHPENYDLYTKKRNINLILSGHNHGGQIRIFGKGLYARNQGLFPKYDGGVYENRLIVSRGLSNTMPIPRLWNPTELVYIDLEPCR